MHTLSQSFCGMQLWCCSAEVLCQHDVCSCSADILKDFGLEWVILGHSERRSLMHETSEVSAACILLTVQSINGTTCTMALEHSQGQSCLTGLL